MQKGDLAVWVGNDQFPSSFWFGTYIYIERVTSTKYYGVITYCPTRPYEKGRNINGELINIRPCTNKSMKNFLKAR